MIDPEAYWRPWSMPADPNHHLGWAELAARVDPDQLPERVSPTSPDARGEGWQRGALEAVWSAFVRRRIPYQDPAWVPTMGQRIRDPKLIDVEGGTCLDLVSYLAAMCLQAGLRPHLVVDPAFSAGSGHAVLGVELGSERGIATRDERHGVVASDREEVCERADLFLLDPMFGAAPVDASATDRAIEDLGTVEDKTVEELERAVGVLPGWPQARVQVIDVAVAQASVGRHPLDLTQRPDITAQLPQAADWTRYRSREAALEEVMTAIARRRGRATWVLVSGAPGSGKSRLAYEVAAGTDGGAAWFLHGSSKSTFQLSLATAFAREASRPVGDDRLGRQEDADAGLARLNGSTRPWVVVIDNANLAPGELGLLPSPGPGQVVVVTTQPQHLADWRLRVPNGVEVSLGPLSDEDLAEIHADLDPAALPEPIRTPLLLRALSRLPLEHRPGLAGDDPVRQLVEAVLASLPEGVAAAATAIPWFPAEGLPASLVPGGADVGSALVAARLLTPSLARTGAEPTYDLHRSFGAELRTLDHDLDGMEHALSPSGQAHLDRFGDSESLDQLIDAVAALEVGTPGRAAKLMAIARVLELHGRIVRDTEEREPRSAEACALLAEEDPEVERDPLLQRACDQAIARAVNQDSARNEPTDDAEEAQRRQEHLRMAIGRCERVLGASEPDLDWYAISSLRGLLLRKASGFLRKGDRLAALREVEEILVEARNRREEIITGERRELFPEEPDRWELDPIVARGRYNLAGVWGDYAKTDDDQDRRRQYLDRMIDVYESVYELRCRIYGDHRPHPHIAICRWGMGLALYQRIWLLDDPRTTAAREKEGPGFHPVEARVGVLRAAAAQLHLALADQEKMLRTDGVDIGKSLGLLFKVTAARRTLAARPIAVRGLDRVASAEFEEMLERLGGG